MEIRSDRERLLILVPAVPHVLVLRRSRTGPWGKPFGMPRRRERTPRTKESESEPVQCAYERVSDRSRITMVD